MSMTTVEAAAQPSRDPPATILSPSSSCSSREKRWPKALLTFPACKQSFSWNANVRPCMKAHWDKMSWQRACSWADTLSHTVKTNATSDILVFASPQGDTSKIVSAEGVTHTSWTSGVLAPRTIAGAPVGEEDADEYLKGRHWAGSTSIHQRTRTRLPHRQLRIIFTTIPFAHPLKVAVRLTLLVQPVEAMVRKKQENTQQKGEIHPKNWR